MQILLQRCRVPGRVSVATSVFVVAFTALTAATGHLFQFVQAGSDVLSTVFGIVIFTMMTLRCPMCSNSTSGII